MIVGFCGRKYSGKDTAAKALIERGFVNIKFAGPLKDMLRSLLVGQGVEGRELERMIEGDLKEVPTLFLNGQTPRHAMQTIGTEWGRGLISDSLWVDAAMRTARFFDKVVITDVRFPNEVEAVKAHGGIVIRVSRGTAPADDHPSEALIDTLAVDHDVINDGTIEDLHLKVCRILNIQ